MDRVKREMSLPENDTLTFLLTDIEGSTELWEQHPEAVRQAMVRHDALVESAVKEHNGLLVRPRGEGDSRFAVFPLAADALKAAIAIQLTFKAENWTTPNPLQVRIGLHTGAAELRLGDYYGDAVNRCARIRGLGHGGQTLLSAKTAGLVEKQLPEGVLLRDMGQHRMKGLSQPEQVFQLHVPGLPDDFPALKSLPIEIQIQPPAFLEAQDESEPFEDSVFVGREREMARLDEFMAKVLEGQGQVSFIVGDAGRGKTILARAFARQTQSKYPDLVVAGGNCNAYTGIGDPYLPFREILELLTGDVETSWAAGAVDTEYARRLWHLAPGTAQVLLNSGPDLLNVFYPGPSLVTRMHVAGVGSTEWLARLEAVLARRAAGESQPVQQNDLFDQYTHVLQLLAKERPLLLILDDLQWADSGSINLLVHLGRRLAGSRILIAGNYRPDEVALGRDGKRHPLEKVVNEFQRQFGDLIVDLHQAEGQAFIGALLDTEPNQIGDDFREDLYQRTKGHALFTTEMVQGLKERGDLVQDEQGRWMEAPSLNWEILPARIEGVIGERIGRLLERFQETLRVASVEGETFTAELVARLQGIDSREMVRQLSKNLDRQHNLVRAQGSHRADGQRLSQYRFRHIFFQLYLYNSLDEVERQYLHEALGNELENLYSSQTEEVAVELARHFEKAGMVDKAVAYLYQAGIKAVHLTANEEAIAHFEHGIALLETEPETDDRIKQELKLQIALFAPLAGSKGYGAPEVGQAYRRARELCDKVDDTDQLFQVLYGLWGHNLVRSELKTSRTLAVDLLDLAERVGKNAFLMEAHRMVDESAFYMGEFGRARRHLQQSLALYDPQKHRSHAEIYGQDPGVALLSHGCCIMWQAGYPQQALHYGQEAVALAQRQDHPFSLGFALCYSAMMHQYRREPSEVLNLTNAAIKLSRDQGFVIWMAQATFLQGWAVAEQGRIEEGISKMAQGLSDWQASGTEFLSAYLTALLATAHVKNGRIDEALDLLAESFAAVSEKSQGFYEAELHRLKGEFLLQQGSSSVEVEELYQQAIKIAQQRQALSQELRAAISLSRLWQSQGKSAEAYAALSTTYGRFEEGFDTADLLEAKDLLHKLAGS